MRTYTRINEDFLDNDTIDTEDISLHDEIYSEIDQWSHGGTQPLFDLNVLGDAIYPVSDKDELSKIIELSMSLYGNECSLNWIDVSRVTDMSYMFGDSQFNGNISSWDVSHAKNMHGMFYTSHFNGNISDWDVSSVEDMGLMFIGSSFSGNISDWDVSHVKYMQFMFNGCHNFNSDISSWDTSSVILMTGMFSGAYSFNQDLSKWNVSNVKLHKDMFGGCPLENRPDKQPKFND